MDATGFSARIGTAHRPPDAAAPSPSGGRRIAVALAQERRQLEVNTFVVRCLQNTFASRCMLNPVAFVGLLQFETDHPEALQPDAPWDHSPIAGMDPAVHQLFEIRMVHEAWLRQGDAIEGRVGHLERQLASIPRGPE